MSIFLGKLLEAELYKFSEYEVKAAFIFNFSKFVSWPEGHFSKRKRTINLCILGTGFPLNTFDYFEGETAQNYTFTKKRVKDLSDIDGCDMLFICSSERFRIDQIIKTVKNMPILTIGDTEGFAEKGVIINLYMEENKVRFEINIDAARQARLSISSHLLKLARIIQNK
ncbi:MAG: YfiR family protein [Syntrophorhabdaceae bacterium]|nr:YfiR family protein [Syntrophorhabdaceae bacterium]